MASCIPSYIPSIDFTTETIPIPAISSTTTMMSFYDDHSYSSASSDESVLQRETVLDSVIAEVAAAEPPLPPLPPPPKSPTLESTKQYVEQLEIILHSFVDESSQDVHWSKRARRYTFETTRPFVDTLSVPNHNVFTDLETCLQSDVANYIFEPRVARERRGFIGGIAVFSKFRRIYLRNRITHYLSRLDVSDPNLYEVLQKFCDIVITANA